VLTRPDVDPDRVGVVGVCMGGGYAVSVAARDKRVKAVASVAGGYDIGGTFQRFLGVDGFAAYYRTINDLVQREYETGDVQYVPTIAHALSAEVPVAAMPNDEAYSYYDRTHRDHAPAWSPKMTAASFGPYFIYNAVAHAPLVAPTPLLIVHGTRDLFLLPEYAQAAYDAAVGPKQLVWIETHNHIELYDQDPYVSQAVSVVVGFLDTHLSPGRGAVASVVADRVRPRLGWCFLRPSHVRLVRPHESALDVPGIERVPLIGVVPPGDPHVRGFLRADRTHPVCPECAERVAHDRCQLRLDA